MSILPIWTDDFESGKQALFEFIRTNVPRGNPFIASASLVHLAEVHQRQGQLRQAQTLYEQALATATDAKGQRLPISCRALIGLAEIHREWNDFDAAVELVREGVELSKRWRAAVAAGGYLSLARIRQAQGDFAGANGAIEQAWQLAVADRAMELDDWSVAMYRAQLGVVQGDLDSAQLWARERGLDHEIDLSELDRSEDYAKYHLRKYEYLVLARLRIAQGRADDALALLEPLAARMQQRGRVRLVIEALMLQAIALKQKGNADRASAALTQALTLAAPEGFVRVFVDEGEKMRLLISDWRRQIQGQVQRSAKEEAQRLQDHADRLLAAFKAPLAEPAKSQTADHRAETIIEPLSPRERQVLQLLADGLSNKAIAHKLVVADETVKKHLKNIYGKLGAHSRTEALARARELDLL